MALKSSLNLLQMAHLHFSGRLWHGVFFGSSKENGLLLTGMVILTRRAVMNGQKLELTWLVDTMLPFGQSWGIWTTSLNLYSCQEAHPTIPVLCASALWLGSQAGSFFQRMQTG